MSDATDASGSGPNSNPEEGGEDEGTLLEKVGALVEKTTGLKLSDIIAREAAKSASQAAEEAGKKAQRTYDPKLTKLETELKRLGQENLDTKRKLREAQIAAMPEAAREAARKLAEVEDANEGVKEQSWRANEALRRAHAREFALDLKERGIAGFTYEDFLPFDSLEEMKEKFAEIRAEHAENALKEAIKGTSESSERKPPASSTTPSRGKGGASGAGGAAGSTRTSGDKPWAEQKGKGLDENNLANALRRMQEEDYRGDK